MPRYRYILEDPTGQQQKGELVADNVQAAREELTSQGTMRVVELKVVGSTESSSSRLSRGESEELAAHLSELTSGGIPLEDGLRVLGQEVQQFSLFGGGRVRRHFEGLAARLEQGQSLDDAVEEQGAPADLVAVIRAGVRSGDPGRALTQYVTYVKSLSSLRGRVTLSFAYPAIMFALAATLFICLMVFIVPDFSDIFTGFGIELPATTAILLGVSWFFKTYGVVFFLSIAAGVVALFFLSRLLSKRTRRAIQLRVPFFGRILQSISMARFTHSLGFLVENEVPMAESLTLAGESTGDAVIAHATYLWVARLRSGEALRDAVGDLPGVHSELLQAIQWQSDSRFLSRALHALGEMYEGRARIEAARIIAITEPVIALGSGLVFGFVVVALFYPLVVLMNDLS